MTFSQPGASVTSSSTVSTSTDLLAAARWTTSALASERTLPTVRYPRLASSRAVSSPMPELAPVTRAVRVDTRGRLLPPDVDQPVRVERIERIEERCRSRPPLPAGVGGG